MRYLISIGLVCVFIFPILAQAKSEEDNWKKKKDKNDVQCYTKEIPGSSFKAFKGETIVDATFEALISLVFDFEHYTEWVYSCEVSRVLKKVSDEEYYTYTVNSAPWPVSDRDAVTHLKIQEKSEDRVIIAIKGKGDLVDETDYVRVAAASGKWEFQKLANGKVKVIYELHTDPSGSIPSGIANAFVVDFPYHTLRNLHKEVKLK